MTVPVLYPTTDPNRCGEDGPDPLFEGGHRHRCVVIMGRHLTGMHVCSCGGRWPVTQETMSA